MSDDPKFDMSSLVQSLIANNGNDAKQALATVAGENKQLRDERRDLREKVTKYESDGYVPEGKSIVDKNDVETFAKYKELGTFEDLKNTKEGFEKVTTELSVTKHNLLIKDVSETHNYKTSVLESIVKASGLKIEMGEREFQDSEGNTKKERTAFVATDSGKTPLPEYIDNNHKDFLPALKAESGEQKQEKSQQWVKQSHSNGGGKSSQQSSGDAVDNYMKRMYSNESGKENK